MEFSSRHFAHLPRRFGAAPIVQGIGHIQKKTDWVHTTFDTFNYSFILRGRGTYRRGGVEYAVAAPCLITQWPDEFVEYGPTTPPGFWEEVFVRYRASDLPYLLRFGLVANDQPVWPIRAVRRLTTKLSEVAELTHLPDEWGNADRIDAACISAVIESHLGQQSAAADQTGDSIRRIRAQLHSRYLNDVNIAALAEEAGMSPTSFRRHWARHVHAPPARYIMELRIREARRLLVETTHSIGEIAHTLRFSDPLYFSRKFRNETGMSATEYRRMHRMEATP